jgi:hypothetical protein
VSLHHFQNCNTLIINYFRNYGVEDELELVTYISFPNIEGFWREHHSVRYRVRVALD